MQQSIVYKRKVLPFESIFIHTPGIVIAFIAEISGNVDQDKFIYAVKKLTKIYPILRSKITWDRNGESWIEETECEEPIKIFERTSDYTWKKVFDEATKQFMDLEKGPLHEFMLIRSDTKSEIIFRGHHLMTDGVGMVRILDLLLQFMNNPNLEVNTYSIEEIPNGKTLRRAIKPKLTFKQRIQNAWDRILFPLVEFEWKRTRLNLPKEDRLKIHDIYFKNYEYIMLTDEFTEDETSVFAKECKKHDVTVNSAMAAAFLACRKEVDPEHENNRQFVSVDLRRHLGQQAKESISCYASTLTLSYVYDAKKEFWGNAKEYHKLVKKNLDACAEATHVINFSNLTTDFIWAVSLSQRMHGVPKSYENSEFFKKLGPKSPHVAAIFGRFSTAVNPSFTITNMGRASFSNNYGPLKLEKCIISPSFVPFPPLSILLSVVTLNNKLTIAYHMAKKLDDETINYEKVISDIKARYKEFLTRDIFNY